MPYFDPREQRLHARVVYDGPFGAGKTENLRGLARLVAGLRDGAAFSPEDLGGHTLVLDWLEIHAGVVAGMPLVCQIVAVPGHPAFAARRRAILRRADVIVHVCKGDAEGVVASRRAIAELAPHARASLVVQANHRDAEGALPVATIARALRVDPRDVVEATASAGSGVVDTFVAAVRHLSRELTERATGESRARLGRPEGRDAMVAAVSAIAPDPVGAAELYLRATDDELAHLRAERRAILLEASPSLPDDAVATGFVWPADTGRAVLRRLADRGVKHERARLHGDGRYMHVAHDHVFETRRARRYDGAEAAKAALVAEARAATQLEGLLVQGTILAAKESADGALWIWTARPEIARLDAALDPAIPERTSTLEAFGAALALARRIGRRHALRLDLRITSFGLQRGAIRYVGALGAGDPEDLRAALDGLAPDDAAMVEASYERELQRLRARDDDVEARPREARSVGAETDPR